MIIAIDGPSGAGKSTLADSLALRLGFIHIDTGAMYRAVGLYSDDKGVSTNDEEGVKSLLPDLSVGVDFCDGRQVVSVNGYDVTMRIRQPEVSMFASNVSKHQVVREYLVGEQRRIAGEKDVIMDGRDIGTVVFPDADVKIFLTATPETRARRRYQEQIEKGFSVSYEDVLADVLRRDEQDMNRAIAPLRPAEDAILLDTSNKTYDESLEALLAIVNAKR